MKISALESLRGIAALSVAISHFQINSHFNLAFTNNAYLMVDFFFILSGFVIALNYQKKIINFNEFKIFQTKRFLRLYPLHLLMLFVFLVIEILKYLVEIKFGLVANTPAFEKSDLKAFIANIFLIHNWVMSNISFNTPSWSISAEFYTYAIFGFIIIACKRLTNRIILFSTIIVIISGLILLKNGYYDNNISGPTRCMYSFFLGVITYNLYLYYDLKKITSSFLPTGMLVLSALFITKFGENYDDNIILLMPFLFAISIFLIVSTSEEALIQKILSNKILVYFGTISYGIYMLFSVVWWIYFQTLRFVFNIPTKIVNGSIIPDIQNHFVSDFLMLSGLVLIIFLAHLSYHFVEMRFNKIRHSIK